jgi:beta-lactamase superfamily II metal-dependent hydrolase
MTMPAITVEALPAGYGDALLVTCSTPAGPWRLLVDTGPDECWPALKARLASIPPDAAQHRHIDLAVISHIDHDHIGAAAALFSDRSLGLSFGDVWFNAPSKPAARGVAEGQSLAAILGAQPIALPWNKAWGGRHVVTTAASSFVELPHQAGVPKLTLLSPTPASLATLFAVWNRELGKLGRAEPAAPPQAAARDVAMLDVARLAAKVTAVDHAPANGSSITLLVEHAGASVLLGADAHPTVLIPALKALAAHRGLALPLQLDVFKLSHHGSQANVTTELMRTVQARHYIVSTNGAIFGHPNDSAIARVIASGGAHRELWFNYRSEHSAKWGSAELQQAHGYLAHLPSAQAQIVLVSLGAKA